MPEITPSFALDAELLLKSKMFDKAISLCKNGVTQYPLYLSGWVVLINALKSAGQIDDARNTANYALEIFPENNILVSFREEFDGAFYKVVYSKDKEGITEENLESNDLQNVREVSQNFGNNLVDLAKKLEEVSTPVNDPELKEKHNKPFPSGIISETIASIYISQGAFSEAIEAYRNLLDINPDRKNYYLAQINELEEKL